MAKAKTYEYTVTYRLEAINFDKARDKAADIDRRVEKAGYTKTGETRLRERED